MFEQIQAIDIQMELLKSRRNARPQSQTESDVVTATSVNPTDRVNTELQRRYATTERL